MRCRISWILIAVTVSLLCSCEKRTEDGPIRIGLVAYLKGEGRETAGLDMLIASRMVVDQVNREGGVRVSGLSRPLELVVAEIESNAEQAVNAVRNLINVHQVVAIIGPQYSSDAIPAGEIAEKSHVPLIAPIATHPDVTRGRRYVFRGTFLDEEQAGAMAVFAREELKLQTAAVVFDVADVYSRDLAVAFESAFSQKGGQVVEAIGAVRSEMMEEKLWRQVADSDADGLYLPLYNPLSGTVASLARDNGYRGILLGSDGWDWRFDAKVAAMQDAYMTTSWSSKLEMPKTRSFVNQYRELSRREPGDVPALTYDALMLLVKVIEQQGKTDGKSLREGLLAYPPYFGVGGSIDYVDSGDPIKPVILIKLQDGDARFQKLVVN